LKFQSPFAAANVSTNVTTTSATEIGNFPGLESMDHPHIEFDPIENATDLFPVFIDLFILGGCTVAVFHTGWAGMVNLLHGWLVSDAQSNTTPSNQGNNTTITAGKWKMAK
jgi:hypothetical protein